MRHRKPPALATWLLKHWQSDVDGALAGDLLEEFHRGRSGGWYWRQVMAAIVVHSGTEVRRHRALAVLAIAATWAVQFAGIFLSRAVMLELQRMNLHIFGLVSFGMWFLIGVVSGLLVGLLCRRHRNPILLACAVALFGWALLAIVLMKHGALDHSFVEIIAAASLYYVLAVSGFLVGGILGSKGRDASVA